MNYIEGSVTRLCLRPGEEQVVLRFSAKLVSDDTSDSIRQFIVTGHIYDSTISVYEVARINSGSVAT